MFAWRILHVSTMHIYMILDSDACECMMHISMKFVSRPWCMHVWCAYVWYISMILVPWPWCMYNTWMYDAHIHDLCPWCMYDAQMYDAHIRDPCPWSWCMHDACILVLECMMHTPAAAPPIENRIKKRHRHTFNGRSSSRSGQGFYGDGIVTLSLREQQ